MKTISKNHYIIMAKKNNKRFYPISGVTKDGKPIFTLNKINGLVLWDIYDSQAEEVFQNIRNKHPNITFDFRKAN